MTEPDDLKSRQQTIWATGDYSLIASRLVIVSELLCESVDLRANIAEEHVLHKYFPLDPHAPPDLWGTQEGLAKLLGDNIASLCVVPRSVIYRFRSPEAYVDALQIGLG